MVTLPADGDFYTQRGNFSKDRTLSTLKTEMIDIMINNKQGFFFPANIQGKTKEGLKTKTNAAAMEVKKREVVAHRHKDLRNALETLDYWNEKNSPKSPSE